MKKAYLLVYSPTLGSREQIKECINSLQEIITWRYDMPNSFYLISGHEAKDLSDAVRSYFNNKGRFLITEISDNRQGWLPEKTWHLIRNKEAK